MAVETVPATEVAPLPDIVPQDLVDRFLPQENPRFDLIKSQGAVRLWRSICERAPFDGMPIESTRYHITEGNLLGASHMSRLNAAELNFDLAVHYAELAGLNQATKEASHG